MTDTTPAQYPRHFHSRLINQICIVQNFAEEQKLLDRFGWRPISVYTSLPYPKLVYNAETREERTITDRREEEQLTGSWLDKETLPSAKPEPAWPHLHRRFNGNLEAKPYRNPVEEQQLRALGYVNINELFPEEKQKQCQKSK